MTSISSSVNLDPNLTGTITDHKYSPTGQFLALSDSQGYIHIYAKKEKAFLKINQFKAQYLLLSSDEGSIWSISWGDIKYGNILGIGTLRSRVIIFQEINKIWKEIAYHDLHQASVNWVEFSPFGLKLFGGSSDGTVSVLELHQKNWKFSSFKASDYSVVCLAIQPLPLGESVSEQNAQKVNPRILTVTKDQKIKIWAHQSENCLPDVQKKKGSDKNNGYYLLKQLATPNLTIRNMLWRPSWGSFQESYEELSLIAGCTEGIVKQFHLNLKTNQKQTSHVILEGENQIVRISQSLTGNIISISLINKTEHETYIYEQIEVNEWKMVGKGPI